MCRLLLVHSKKQFNPQSHLKAFANVARQSPEYQGHGWGYASFVQRFEFTHLFLAHARSAFRDEGISIENNMPFISQGIVFIFNGELHGVRIRERGRIGAEKIFNYLLRFSKNSLLEGVERGVPIIQKRSNFIRAMNMILCDGQRAVVSTQFNQEADYFTMHYHRFKDMLRICSQPYPGENDWQVFSNHTRKEFAL